MRILRCLKNVFVMSAFAFLIWALPAPAQETSQASTGTKYGDYNVQQTVEVGFRYVNMGGNMANYDTFENLNSGARLLDYTLDVTSPDHKGKLFDNISLYNFGYGGDPNNLTHLRITKSRFYEFTGQFRRDQNFFAYNLLANPLNTSTFSPATPITFAPHNLDLVHRMTDLNLTLMPQSRVSVRLGYSRNVNEGPSFTTLDGGTEPQLFQQFKTTMNSYNMGADFKILPKTTFSYDEFLQYFKQDTGWFDQNLSNFQLAPPNGVSGGVPVDLGIVFQGTAPCAGAVANPITVPPTAKPNCNGFLSYSHVARPRTSFPTEHLSFQSSYIKNLTMSGQLSYAKANSYSNDYLESFFGNTARTFEQLTSQAGPTDAKRVTVVGDWAGTYSMSDKLRLVDEFGYSNYRIPGAWNFAFASTFARTNPSGPTPSMLVPPAISPQATIAATIAQFDAACSPSNGYTGATCPHHGSSSPADQSFGSDVRFLGQKLKANKFQVEYDFKPRLGGRLGFGYTSRTISDFNGTDFSPSGKAELFLPGPEPGPITPGALGAPSAQRGDCALQNGALPAGCLAQPDGSILFTGDNSDPSRNIVGFNEYSLLAGIWARPKDQLRTSFDLVLTSADGSFTRITPRQSQQYRVHATYTARNWATFDGSFTILESRDNVQFVNYLAHNRSASFVATLMPHEKYSFDLGYTYDNVLSQSLICYNYASTTTLPAGGIGIACTLPAAINAGSNKDSWQTNGFYKDIVHYPFFDFMFKPVKRISTTLGYAGTFTRGSMPFLNPLQPSGTLSYTYQKPYASVSFDAGGGISYKAAWSYYGYNPRGIQVPTIAGTTTSLAVPATGFNSFLQDFNGNTVMFSLRYSH